MEHDFYSINGPDLIYWSKSEIRKWKYELQNWMVLLFYTLRQCSYDKLNCMNNCMFTFIIGRGVYLICQPGQRQSSSSILFFTGPSRWVKGATKKQRWHRFNPELILCPQQQQTFIELSSMSLPILKLSK